LRIRITTSPAGTVDGVPLDKFFVGSTYDVPTWLGNYFFAQRWAVPVESHEPALVLPLNHPIAERIGPKHARAEAADNAKKTSRTSRS
jgi:hypothetical protein